MDGSAPRAKMPSVVDNAPDLKVLLACRHPLIVVGTRDETRFLDLLSDAADEAKLVVWTWSPVRGLARDGFEPQYETADPSKALAFVEGIPKPGVFVFLDVHHALKDPGVVRRVKEFALSGRSEQTLVLCSPDGIVPEELQGIGVRWTLRPPDRAELKELVVRILRELKDRDVPLHIGREDVDRFVEALAGLSLTQASHVIQKAALHDGKVTADDVEFVRREKAGMLGSSGVLEIVGADVGTLDDVGGLARLKEWLSVRGKALGAAAAEFGLDAPRGVLLTGIPGCGKSFVAKTLARTWDLPLVLLDPARIYGPYIGESEQRLAEALRTADAMAPCVLWIDEVEKGFASGRAGDTGVSERVRGTFLRWLQDRPAGVFVVATCNDVWALPPEFMRKGRFDEVFFVDLPNPDEREGILRTHLSKRGRDPLSFDLEGLAEAADGFSGAELEAAVVGALYRAFADGAELTTEAVVDEIEATVPLSRSRAEEVDALRAWASERAVAA